MKILTLLLLVSGITAFSAIHENNLTWHPNGGIAAKPPELTETQNGPEGKKAILAKAVAEGGWQGITAKFNPPADLSQYAGVEFYFRHNFMGGMKSLIALNIQLVGGQLIYRGAICGKANQWNKVVVPFDTSAWETDKTLKVVFRNAVHIEIYPYAAMRLPGQTIEISDFRFLPKSTDESRELGIMEYFYKGTGDSGDSGCTRLKDGELKQSVTWPAYSDDPDIVFDLGGIQAVDQIKVNAFSSSAHNFSELTIQFSQDGKSWVPGAMIKNPGGESKIKLLEFNYRGKKLTGRYFRIKATRERTDFPISFTEVTFLGHPATEAEKTAAVNDNYDNGPVLPERGNKDYFKLAQHDWELWIHKKTGVINGIFFRGKLIAERLSNSYLLQSRKQDFPSDAYSDQVTSAHSEQQSLTFTVTNPGLPGLELEKCYSVETGALTEKLTVRNKSMKERRFLRVVTEVILNREFRGDGYYETLGSGHVLRRWHASEIMLETASASVPTLFFENPRTGQTILHCRTYFNGKFAYFDHCSDENTSSGVRTNGWFIGGMTIVPESQTEQSCVNRFAITDGNLLDSYRAYIELPETAAFRRQIQRPTWLRDVIVDASLGWNGLCGQAYDRYFGNLLRMLKRGYITDPALLELGFCWGDWPSEGIVRDFFGGVRTAEQVKEKIARLKNMSPRIKLGLYTWLWSAFPWSETVKQHPEWFVKYLRSGAPASWFPNCNINWQQLMGIPESRQAAFEQIRKLVEYYDCDIWYLDGGNAGSVVRDWDTMRIDDVFGWTNLYQDMRSELRRQSPDKIFFCNTPCNPLGDIGYLESFSGAMTSEWRIGAAWMFQFKMFQYRDPLHHPTYIYWLSGVDGAYQNYMLGTGLCPSLNSHSLSAADIPYLSARYEVRNLGIVNANVSPDWRHDRSCELECMPLTQGNAGFVFMQQHGKKKNEAVSTDAVPLGISDPEKPVYQWCFTIKDGRKKFGLFGEPQLAKAYAATGWMTDRAVIPEFLGKSDWQKRLSNTFEIKTGEAKLWMITQVPAFIRSVEDVPAHFRLPYQPGITVTGDLDKLSVDSEFDCEIAALLPERKVPAAVILNGKEIPFKVLAEKNFHFVPTILPKGKSVLTFRLKEVSPEIPLQPVVKLTGRKLSINGIPDNIPVSIYHDEELCLASSGSFTLTLPDVVGDGNYTVTAGRQNMKFAVKGLAKPLWIEPELKPLPVKQEIKEVTGDIVLGTATAFSQNAGFASVDSRTMSLEAGTLPSYDSFYNIAAAALELKLKRYVKLEFRNGLKYHNLYGYWNKHHFPRHDSVDCFGGLILDFGSAQGYTVRSAAGMGKQTVKRQSVFPKWGKQTNPNRTFSLNDAIHEDKHDMWSVWLDLNTLGAPTDWNGKIWLTLLFENLGPDRRFGVRVMETTDVLPPNAKTEKPLELGIPFERKVFKLPKVSPEELVKRPPLGRLILEGQDVSPSFVRVGYDDRNLYLHYDFDEPNGKIPESEFDKVWFNDSIEFNIQLAERRTEALHGVINTKGKFFAEINLLNRTNGSKTTQLHLLPAQFKADLQPRRWQFLVTIPLAELGISGHPEKGLRLGFNLMRNRVATGKMNYYSLIPGNWFSGDIYQIEF